ncbi:hypothetical protein Drose_06475 [Dactylosporangium roseum]|uniref:HTH araC/xylS-type domain-containing protein n=1 Tax=Dactylosporangium roseum TaxID=47989 RepID=A0ABY5ZA99_9ACTN|nr:hypothetical protein [Dactylosporangium roseum]UWZ37918.1 hypothetical protein Drose_06475 [Dactylosporangium roseum]
MPRAKDTTTGPEADALDAAAKVFARIEEQFERARADLQAKAIAAIDADMSVAEAARRAGYTREHLSKVYTAVKGHPPKRHTREKPPVE